jgi:hypothetical protein
VVRTFWGTTLRMPEAPPWQRLASSFHNGATIPYLLKALRIHSGISDSLSVEECRIELHELLKILCEDPPEPHLVGLETRQSTALTSFAPRRRKSTLRLERSRTEKPRRLSLLNPPRAAAIC